MRSFIVVMCCTYYYLTSIQSTYGATEYVDDITLTSREFKIFRKFKASVLPKIPPNSIVTRLAKDDLYLLRWLRAKHFNLHAAQNMLFEHLKWRELKNLDSLDEQDWTTLQADYPLYTDTEDKEGRPIGEIHIYNWKFRPGWLVLDGVRLLDWLARMFEILNRQVYERRSEGRNVSQAILTSRDARHYYSACPYCVALWVGIATMYGNNYPGLVRDYFYMTVNTGLKTAMQVVQPLLGPGINNELKPFFNQDEWIKAMDRQIERSQRSPHFGGTLIRDLNATIANT